MSKIVDLAEARRKRAKQADDEAYKQALTRIIERANKADW